MGRYSWKLASGLNSYLHCWRPGQFVSTFPTEAAAPHRFDGAHDIQRQQDDVQNVKVESSRTCKYAEGRRFRRGRLPGSRASRAKGILCWKHHLALPCLHSSVELKCSLHSQYEADSISLRKFDAVGIPLVLTGVSSYSVRSRTTEQALNEVLVSWYFLVCVLRNSINRTLLHS